MVYPDRLAKVNDSKERIEELLRGAMHLPILDEEGRVKEIQFYIERVKSESFPVVRGKSPFRISFGGGGTDLNYFFEKYGGAVINSTIDKYCHATIKKRADMNITVDSDFHKEPYFFSLENIQYDGQFDIIKAIVKLMRPDFGFDLCIHNDIPPGRGLGSSASLSVLIISLLNYIQDTKYDEYKIAEIAFKTETQELGIRGGWQDQYASVIGGFNFMEFGEHKNIIYPLKLKDNMINELKSHLTLCYIGKSHNSGEQHEKQQSDLSGKEEYLIPNLNKLKGMAIEIKDCLLTGKITKIGELLHDSWQNKRLLGGVSNDIVDKFYDNGLKNGAIGGKLLGAGGGGYVLFFHNPNKRNQLVKALEESGGEIMNFNFEQNGTKIWSMKES